MDERNAPRGRYSGRPPHPRTPPRHANRALLLVTFWESFGGQLKPDSVGEFFSFFLSVRLFERLRPAIAAG